jgi:hypothetical protein
MEQPTGREGIRHMLDADIFGTCKNLAANSVQKNPKDFLIYYLLS